MMIQAEHIKDLFILSYKNHLNLKDLRLLIQKKYGKHQLSFQVYQLYLHLYPLYFIPNLTI